MREKVLLAAFLFALLLPSPSDARWQQSLKCAFSSREKRIRYRCRVAYDGSRFNGWQYQNNARTVQGELEGILSQRFNRTIRIVGAGRTDAGVHARGQAFHFDLMQGELDDVHKLQTSLNSMLERDVRVWNLQEAPPPITKEAASNGTITTFPWHVIYNSKQKLYSYRICTAASMDPLLRHSRQYVDWGDVDVIKLEWALKQFEGTHNFRAFSGAIEQKERHEGKQVGTVRTVYKVDFADEGHGLYRIDFLLQGALYKMVRNMMGTALDVSRNRLKKDTFLELLHHNISDDVDQFVRDDNPCKPAPPEGLTLERVFFDGDF